MLYEVLESRHSREAKNEAKIGYINVETKKAPQRCEAYKYWGG